MIQNEENNKPGSEDDAYEYVDLGLSVNWATFNIGATKPEEYGDYYAWGETETKTDYSWESYKWCNGSANTLTKYCDNSEYGNIDNKYLLDPDDDVAHVKWGGKWYMPTIEEIGELMDKCSWTMETRGEIEGFKVTGPNGNSIFLPVAGFYAGTDLIESEMFENSNEGYIWSSNRGYNNFSDCLLYSGADGRAMFCSNTCYRYLGFPVRPVCPSEYLSIALDNKDISLYLPSGSLQLKATVLLRGELLGTPGLIWESDNDSVAYVSQQGRVYAVSEGTANIIVTCGGHSDSCKVTVTERPRLYENGYEYVDLGLSVKWATCNIGATEVEEFGNYYGWGEVEPKQYYSYYNYRFYDGGDLILDRQSTIPVNPCNIKLSKYNTTDNKNVLDPEDDAAHVNWGGNWRMPTVAEWQELIDSCFWTTTIMNDVEGFLISEGPASWMPGEPFIFLPFAGTMEYNYDLETGVYVESEEMRAIGVYWAKDIPQDFSRQVLETMRPFVSVCAGGYFAPTLTTYGFVRVYGMPIRPVCPKE